MHITNSKPTVAIHKFTSCDGCQLAILNLGEALLTLTELVDIKNFAEAGILDEDAQVDIAFIEGSISTPREMAQVKKIRGQSHYLISMGACATSGGIQALRNMHDGEEWINAIYASPQHIESLATSTPLADHVRIDLELWGCPVSSEQIATTIRALLFGVLPRIEHDKVCLECKRSQAVCVMVSRSEPCMGPVTNTGCGALCPQFGRACYACYGPAENPNPNALANRFEGLGMSAAEISRNFLFINNNAPLFHVIGEKYKNRAQTDE